MLSEQSWWEEKQRVKDIKNRHDIALIAIVHIVMDVYPAALPVLISFLVTDLGLSLAQASCLTTVLKAI